MNTTEQAPKGLESVIAVVRADQTQSELRWEAAYEEDDRWRTDAESCSEAYDEAVAALEAGDIDRAELELERANSLEARGGDNCDAHHALKAVRAARTDA